MKDRIYDEYAWVEDVMMAKAESHSLRGIGSTVEAPSIFRGFNYDINNIFTKYYKEFAPVPPLAHWVEQIIKLEGVTHVAKYEIRGSQVLIAETGAVATQINSSLIGQGGKQELGEVLAMLRADVNGMSTVPEPKKRQIINTIGSVEIEAAEEKPNKDLVSSYLTSIKELMKSAGETFDQVSGWGERLAKIGSLIGLTIG